MNKLTIPIIVVILLVAGFFLFFDSGEDINVPDTAGDVSENLFAKLSTLEFTDYAGTTVTLGDFAGTPLVINSWAAWCPFCRKELPDFARIQKEFGDTIIIIAIDRVESLSTAKKYSDDLGVTDDFLFLLDPSDSFYRAIGGFSMPETIFISADGALKDHKRGVMTIEEIRRRVKDAFDL